MCYKKECWFFHNKDAKLNDVQTGGPRLFHGHIRSVLFCSLEKKRATIWSFGVFVLFCFRQIKTKDIRVYASFDGILILLGFLLVHAFPNSTESVVTTLKKNIHAKPIQMWWEQIPWDHTSLLGI